MTLPTMAALRPWADPTLLAIHRLPMHTPLSGFRRRSLDGDWQLEMFERPADVPAAALTGHRRRAVTVAVPGNWTMQDLGGFVDLPQYTNIQMPFPGPPPALPDRNPTGIYRRSFAVPKAWGRHRVVLGIDAADSVHAVYVNGEFAGYGTDSRLPSEYDVSALVQPGDNELAIVVIRYSAHSYVEDQDQWWMAGLHRSVWVEARPTVHLDDVPVDVTYDPDTGAGSIRVSARVDPAGQAGWQVRTSVTDPDGAAVGSAQVADVPHQHRQPYLFTGFVARTEHLVESARPWSAESPERYTVTVELLDPRGRVTQVEVVRVGLRSVAMRDGQLLVNGQPIWIFGVNRHDHHPDRGKAVTVDDLRADLVAMRRLNITAIRTSHYPNRDEFYDLCDELGFYVVDEANIESHGYNRSIADDERYRATWLDRGARMVQRDRNHPSVIIWSLGNESGYGNNHDALAGWIRHTDPSRPIQYEDAIRIHPWADGGRAATDIVCPMYSPIADIKAYGESNPDRPLILCEYSHAMGNSNGSLADYWDVITSTPRLQGGFVWEWKDHGLRQRLPDGRTRLAYGGQFGEDPHDGNFVADGLMSADLEPHPAAAELAWVYRPVVVRGDGSRLRIENRRSFVGLGDLIARYQYLAGGEVVGEGELDVPEVAPHGHVRVKRPTISGTPKPDTLLVRWVTVADTWFAPAGHLVAWDEIELGARRAPRRPDAGRSPDELVRPELCIWRAPTDNDGFKLMPELSLRLGVGGAALGRWLGQGLDRRPAHELVDHHVEVERGDRATTYRHVVDVPEELADLPRVGVTFAVPARFREMRWFGRGPHENYPDRNASAMRSTWQGPLDESPYLVPQEFGLRTECEWVELIDPDAGEVIRIDAETPLHASATRYTDAQLFEAAGADELAPADDVIVHLDVAHRGLGTASCGPDVLDRYRLPAGRFEFAYRVTLL